MKLFAEGIGVEMKFVIREDGAPFDLTGTTVELIVEGGITKTCSIVNATNGVCRYLVESGIFSAGKVDAQIKITSGTDIFYTEKFELDVESVVV